MAVAYGLAQLLLLDTGRFLTWDEAIYVSEVSPFAEAVGMGAHRARGVTLMVAPVTSLTDSMSVLRVYLAVVSSAALFGAFVVWCRQIRWAAPIAAALFASCWITLFYGSAVYPNLYSALLVVAAIGVAFRVTDRPSRSSHVLLGALVAAITLIRPLEGLVLVVCLVVVGVVADRTSLVRLVGSGIIGIGVGALPWAIEGWVRFGGPLRRLEISRETVGGGIRNNLAEYLRILDGSEGAVNLWALVWLGVLAVLGLVGLIASERTPRHASWIALITAFLFVAPYLFATEPVLERFMLPGLVMLCLAASLGTTTLAARLQARPALVWPIAVAIAAASVWNLPALQAWDDRQVANAYTAHTLGLAIGEETARACFFLSPSYYPAVSFASGCRGAALRRSVDDNRRLLDTARGAGSDVFVVTNADDPGSIVGGGWRCWPVEPLADRGWQLCVDE